MQAINRNKNKTHIKGAPRIVKSPIVDNSNPDNFPTLMRYLEANGKLRHTTYAVMIKARNLYLRGGNTETIATELRIEPAIVDRWALCFSWDEERDRRLFEQFRSVSGVNELYGSNIGQRHDRIAGVIEQIAERRLQQHANGKGDLSVKDLKGLTDVIRSTQDIRRTVRGQSNKADAERPGVVNNTMIVNVPATMEKVAHALADAFDRPKLIGAKTTTIAVGREEAIGHDTEYETSDGNSEAG